MSSSDEDRDKSSGEEEEQPEDITQSDVLTKYKASASIVSKVIAQLTVESTAGKKISDLCELGDKLLNDQLALALKGKKGVEKGIAFPTSVSPNHCVGHLSPLQDESPVLADGDVIKIDMGVHVDGFIAVSATTTVVGSNQVQPVTGRKADVICAAHLAAEAACRLLKAGHKNSEISDVVKKIAEAFHCQPVEGVLSHQMKRHVIDGNKVIINKASVDQQVEEVTFEEGDVFAVDIVMSTGEGKPKDSEQRTTIFKRAVDQSYNLKLKASRAVFNEINKRFPALPFTLRAIEDKHARFGISEMLQHDLLHPYPVLIEKSGEYVAQVKFTALILPSVTQKLTETPVPLVQSEFKVEDPEVKKILETSVKSSKRSKNKNKKKKKKTEPTATSTSTSNSSSAPVPMDTN